MDAYLKEMAVTEVLVTGLAMDYCVKFTALDARGLGYQTKVVRDACRGVNLSPGDCDAAEAQMQDAGAIMVLSQTI